MDSTLTVLSVLTAFGLYLTSLTAAGMIFTLMLHRPVLGGLPLYRWILWCVVGAVVFACLAFALTATALTGTLSGMFDRAMLGLMWDTPVGDAFRMRVIGLVIIAAALLISWIGDWVAAVGAAVVLGSFVQVGHVGAAAGTLGEIVLFLHLSTIALWMGVLAPLRTLAARANTQWQAGDLGHQFGRQALVLLPVLIAAGVFLTWSILPSAAAVWTVYGLSLLGKIACVAVLLGLGALNKTRYVPGVRNGDATAVSGLRSTLLVEWVMFAAVLLATAILTNAVTLPT
ncbi:MAG: CopD family protein [Pseudomonadota bacterium]